MQMFFSSLTELEHFTHSLATLSPDNACEHCSKNDQWVCHGYVYKQRSIDQREVVGKRLLCAQRYGKNGCGRTRQLYLETLVPRRRYTMSTVLAFIFQLLQGLSVKHAYHAAIGHQRGEPRQAWRWLSALMSQLSRFRLHVSRQATAAHHPSDRHCRRLAVLLPTLSLYVQGANPQYREQHPLF